MLKRRSGTLVSTSSGPFSQATQTRIPRIAPTLISRAGAAPVGGRKPTAPLIGCRRSTLVAESLRRSSVPVAP